MSTIIHPTMKLGKRAPRLDKRTLKLGKYITPALPPPPIRAGYVDKVRDWPMYLNDSLGDCVIAAAAHMIEQWTTYSSSQALVSNQDVLKAYEAVGGYVPGDPTTDNGCDMLTALRYWRQVGIGGHRIKAYMMVDFTNRKEVEQAIWLFGNVYVGIQMPLSAQFPTQTGANPCWSVPKDGLVHDGSPGSWGGHAVPLIGYSNDQQGTPGTMSVTWGALYDVTWNFINAYCDEMWVVLSPDWFSAAGKSPVGFNMAQLAADLIGLGEGKKPKKPKRN